MADTPDKFERWLGKARSRAKDALDWGRRMSTVGKMKIDTTRLQRTRMSVYQELGKKTYLLLKEGMFNPSELDDLVTQIGDLNRRIEEQQQRMAEAAQKPPSDESSQ
ncbi:MAG: hypothetical protein V1798_11185 [Pseudomonadota bacterium]